MQGMQGFTYIDLAVLIVYLLAVLFAGLHFAKKEMKGKEYFKGDGTVPWWVTSVSIFATLLSPISFLSLAGNSYAGTWIMWFAQLGMLLAIPLTIRFFLPIYSKLDIDTAYHYLELRFNSKFLRILGAVMFIIYQIGRMSIIMYLPCMVLSALMGINVNILIIIMGVIAIIYSYTGGLKSVLWTDFIQGSVLLIGVTFGLIFLISHLDGGFGAIINEFTTNHKFLAEDQPIFDANILRQCDIRGCSHFLLLACAIRCVSIQHLQLCHAHPRQRRRHSFRNHQYQDARPRGDVCEGIRRGSQRNREWFLGSQHTDRSGRGCHRHVRIRHRRERK